MSYFNELIYSWKKRKKYPTFIEMPNGLLTFFTVSSFFVTGYFGFVLSEITPEFLRAANGISLSEWGWKGWYLVFILSLIGVYTWLFGNVFWRCNNILRERLFK